MKASIRPGAVQSTIRQDLERQIHALEQVGIEVARIYVDKKSGTTVHRPGLHFTIGCTTRAEHEAEHYPSITATHPEPRPA